MSEIGLTGLKYLQDDVLSAGSTGKLFFFFLCQFQLLETVCLLWLCTSSPPPSLERLGWVLTWHHCDFLCCLQLPHLRTGGITLDNPVCCFSEFPLPLWSFWHCFWHSMCGIFSSTNQFSSLQKQHQISGSLTHLSVLRLTSILTLTTQS